MSRRGGRASGSRAEVFGSALEQAQQLFAAASVDYASRPILVFYGLSQAGRAIAACAAAGGMNDWQLKGHGIEVSNLDQKPGLPDLIVANDGKGSFTQLVPLLHSGSLPAGAPRREDMADHSGFGRISADRHQSWLPSDPPVGVLLGGRSPEFQQLDRRHAAAVRLAQLQRGRIRHLLIHIQPLPVPRADGLATRRRCLT